MNSGNRSLHYPNFLYYKSVRLLQIQMNFYLEYTEKVMEGYESDEDDSYAELDTSTDTVSYGDDKSGKNDVEELKLFDVDDDK